MDYLIQLKGIEMEDVSFNINEANEPKKTYSPYIVIFSVESNIYELMFMFFDEDGTYYHNYNCIIDIKVYYDNCETFTESPDNLTSDPIKFDIYLSDFSI